MRYAGAVKAAVPQQELYDLTETRPRASFKCIDEARCKGCGGTDFKVVKPGALRFTSLMACTACDRVTTYLDLLDDIGEQAMDRANESLAKLKKTRAALLSC